MPEIRFVCVSDLHLGAANSVLTHLGPDGSSADGPAPLLTAVLDGLRHLLRSSGTTTPPTLIVHGDLFELALTTTENTADAFGHLVRGAWGDPDEPLFSHEVLFVPGNHDHHMWEIERENRYQDYLHGAPGRLEPMPHVTPMVPDHLAGAGSEPFVGVLADQALAQDPGVPSPTFRVLYPNLGLADDAADRAVVITHGHYLEPMYRAMSFLHNVVAPKRPPRLDVAQIEADNWAWIDFFWSTMGRSGEGDDAAIPVLYELLQHRGSVDAIVDRLLDDLLPRSRSVLRGAERWTLRRAGRRVSAAVSGRERHNAAVLSPAATTGLGHYLAGPVHAQLLDELGRVPRRVDFVFGHTHKPFAARRHAPDYPGPVVVHNTGGWVIDAVEPEPMKGASIALVDADLEVVDLCIYRQEVDRSRYRVAVTPVNDPPDEATPFRDWLAAAIDPLAEPWAGIAELASRTVVERQHQLEQRTRRGTVAVRTEPPVGPRGW